jgi:hypothetical protein
MWPAQFRFSAVKDGYFELRQVIGPCGLCSEMILELKSLVFTGQTIDIKTIHHRVAGALA